MNRTVKIILVVGAVIVVSLVLLSLAAAAVYLPLRSSGPVPAKRETAPTATGNTGLPNPAAVYCEEQGYALETRTNSDGGQYGVCIFPDGSECDEWAFYRGECAPVNGVCISHSGAKCNEWFVCFDDCPEDLAEVLAARETVLAYLIQRYGEQAPAPDLTWTLDSMTESIAPEGSSGEVTYQFTANGWTVTLSHSLGGSEEVFYTVVVISQSTGFQWEGMVDAAGQVTE